MQLLLLPIRNRCIVHPRLDLPAADLAEFLRNSMGVLRVNEIVNDLAKDYRGQKYLD